MSDFNKDRDANTDRDMEKDNETIDDLDALLPWYMTGHTSEAETTQIDAALKERADLRHSLEVLREDYAEIIAVNESVALPRSLSANRIMDAIEEEFGPEPAARASLLERVGQWMQGLAPQNLAVGAAAACAVVMLQAGVMIYDGGSPSPANYQTASYGQQATAQGIALVRFTADATTADVLSLLQDNQLRIVGGPKSGMFVLGSTNDSETLDADAVIAKLKAERRLVQFVVKGQ